jgi:drug/metabolite transporter (DMT)-like permease
VSHGAKVWTALWTVYVVWGSTYLAIAIVVETMPPLLAVSVRFIAAGSLLGLWCWLRRPGALRVSWRAVAAATVIGLLLPGANAVLFFAERTVPTGLASLIIASVPLWVVLLQLGARVPVPRLAVVGVASGFAGVAVLLHPEGGATTTGLLLCIVSALMWSLGSFLSGRLPLPADPFAATAYEMLAGGLVMLPLGLATASYGGWSAGSIAAWVYLVTIGSVLGYTAYVWLLGNAPLGTVSTYAYVNPVVAILLGFLFRDEHLTVRIAVGAAIVVAAVAVVVRADAPAAGRPE